MTSVMHAPPLEESGSVVGGCMVGRDPVLVPRWWVSRGQLSRLLPLNTRLKTVLERSLTRKYQNYWLKTYTTKAPFLTAHLEKSIVARLGKLGSDLIVTS